MYTACMDSDRLAQINEKLKAAGAKDACLACGSPDLIIDPSAESALLAMNDERVVAFDRAIPVIAIICTNCGFARLHSTLHLLGDQD